MPAHIHLDFCNFLPLIKRKTMFLALKKPRDVVLVAITRDWHSSAMRTQLESRNVCRFLLLLSRWMSERWVLLESGHHHCKFCCMFCIYG